MPDPKAPEGAIAIPKDLREQYDLHKKWLAIPWHERPRGTASVEAILRENTVNDIERIAALTQRAELAESRVKELSKPVTDEEWASTAKWPKGVWRDHLDALIAARSPGMSYEEIQAAYDKRIADSARAASGASDSAPVGGKE